VWRELRIRYGRGGSREERGLEGGDDEDGEGKEEEVRGSY